ncbi:MAG: hypothetical protein U1E65_05365 [Myxococcota bacterium]
MTRAVLRRVASLLLGLGLSGLTASSAFGATDHGAQLIENAARLEDGRYKSPQDWEKTLRFYRGIYGKQPGIVWRSVASTPKVKAIHIANIRRGQSWEGINIYETGGEVFIYVIKAEGASE